MLRLTLASLVGLCCAFANPALAQAPSNKIISPYLQNCSSTKAAAKGVQDAKLGKQEDTEFLQKCPKDMRQNLTSAYTESYQANVSSPNGAAVKSGKECSGSNAYQVGLRDGKAKVPPNVGYRDMCPRSTRRSIIISYRAGYIEGRRLAGAEGNDNASDSSGLLSLERMREEREKRRQQVLKRACTPRIAARAGMFDGRNFSNLRKRYIKLCPKELQPELYKAYARGYRRAMRGSVADRDAPYCTRRSAQRLGERDAKLFTNDGPSLLRRCERRKIRMLLRAYRAGYNSVE